MYTQYTYCTMAPKLIKRSRTTLYNTPQRSTTAQSHTQHTAQCCHQCWTHSNPLFAVHSNYDNLTYNHGTNMQFSAYSQHAVMNNVNIEQRNTIAQAQLKYIRYQYYVRHLQQPVHDADRHFIPRTQQLIMTQ